MLYNKHNLAVADFASQSEAAQPEISGVFFTKDKTVATNRYMLLEVSTPSNFKAEEFPLVPVAGKQKTAMRGFKPFIVPAKDLQEIRIKNNVLPVLECMAVSYLDDHRAEFLTTDLSSGQAKVIRRIEGQYPDYQKIIPKNKPLATVRIDALMLADLLKAMGKIADNCHVDIEFRASYQPLVLKGQRKDQKALGLFMPIKT